MEWFGDFPSFNIPEEVWRIILFDHKLNKESLTNSILASTTLSYVLHLNKPVILFSQALPSLTPYLGTPSFWNCRLVCKTWQNDIDSLLETHIAHQSIPEGSTSLKMDSYPIPSFATCLHSPVSIHETSLSISGHPRNPFPGRSLSVLMTATTRNPILALLNQFGEHIWYLQLKIWERPKLFAQYIMECMQHVPNLKALYICGSPLTGITCNQQLAWEHELERYLYRNYSAKLCHLQTLQFPVPNSCSVAENILKTLRISSVCSTLKQLILEIDSGMDVDLIMSRISGDFLQLEHLELKIRGTVPDRFAALFQNAPVRRLVVTIVNQHLEYQDFLHRILNEFAKTLHVLQLRLAFIEKNQEFITRNYNNVELPNLKTVELMNCFQTLKNLVKQNLKNVENLHVRYNYGLGEQHRSTVLSNLLGKEVITSSVWEKYKHFKLFTLHARNEIVEYFSREMYDFYKAKQVN